MKISLYSWDILFYVSMTCTMSACLIWSTVIFKTSSLAQFFAITASCGVLLFFHRRIFSRIILPSCPNCGSTLQVTIFWNEAGSASFGGGNTIRVNFACFHCQLNDKEVRKIRNAREIESNNRWYWLSTAIGVLSLASPFLISAEWRWLLMIPCILSFRELLKHPRWFPLFTNLTGFLLTAVVLTALILKG